MPVRKAENAEQGQLSIIISVGRWKMHLPAVTASRLLSRKWLNYAELISKRHLLSRSRLARSTSTTWQRLTPLYTGPENMHPAQQPEWLAGLFRPTDAKVAGAVARPVEDLRQEQRFIIAGMKALRPTGDHVVSPQLRVPVALSRQRSSLAMSAKRRRASPQPDAQDPAPILSHMSRLSAVAPAQTSTPGQPDGQISTFHEAKTLAHGEPLRLDTNVEKQIAGMLDIRIPAVKIYANQAADEVARRHQADAVTIQNKIFFRAGKFDTKSAAGLGLLGHELAHAARAKLEEKGLAEVITPSAHKEEELAALRTEQRVIRHYASQRPPMDAPVSANVADVGAPLSFQTQEMAASIGQPRAAATDRNLGVPATGQAPGLTEQQLKQIKEAVYSDLLARLRTEFERGG